MSGRRRKPWIVRKTIGWTDEGKQIQKTIGYYESRPLAMQALAEYNQSPYDISAAKSTFADIYTKWSEKKYETISHSNALGYESAYSSCKPIWNIKFADLRKSHLQGVIDNSGKEYPSRKKIKSLLNQLCHYAMENDIIMKDYSQYVEVGIKSAPKIVRRPYTNDEIQTLFDSVNLLEYVDTILICIYAGLRPSELLLLELDNVYLNERYMIGGIKTEAGKNRIIPINKKILPFIQKRYNEGKEKGYKYLVVNFKGEQMKYSNYKREKFDNIMEQLNMKHLPHDGRHTCATLLNRANANSLSIKRILGHSSQDITDKVYTHKTVQDLLEAIDLI